MDNGEIEESFLCPISQNIMQNPVLAEDGFCYEKKIIEDWFNRGKDTSPFTGLKIGRNLIPNHHLKSLIQAYYDKKNQCNQKQQTRNMFFDINDSDGIIYYNFTLRYILYKEFIKEVRFYTYNQGGYSN